MRAFLTASWAAVLLAAACQHPSRGGTPPDRDVLTADEMSSTDLITAYDAVKRLRPRFLISRGEVTIARRTDSVSHPAVFLNDRDIGSVDRLNEILVANIAEIRFYDPASANMKFGSGYMRGVIQVKLK